MKIKCPQCGNQVEFSGKNQWRPFCSERCKLIDFGDWIDGGKRIPDNMSLFETQADNASKLKH